MLSDSYPKTLKLKDGRSAVLRLLTRDDFEQVRAFLLDLPDEDRLFLRHDVRDPDVVRRWTEDLDLSRMIPLVALEDDSIVATGRLYRLDHGWMRHVGHVRLITARSHRNLGLGGLITRELVALAAERDIEKLQAHVVEDSREAVRMFKTLGFETEAVLKGMVKDQHGQPRNLAIMVNDVVNLSRIMDDWIQDSMIPSFRVPGAGV
ncbi:MAG: GNAT family N-acetyltransferase [Phycisphaerales bacterium]|nr:MAG: GNAT family N-acetyltransferase [Phycisphaerales bacterium]